MLQAPRSHLQNGSSSLHPSSIAGLACAGLLSLSWWPFPIAEGPFQLFSFPAAVMAEDGPDHHSKMPENGVSNCTSSRDSEGLERCRSF